jgi:hypothetical protein
MIDLDFKNGFWIDNDWSKVDRKASHAMWLNFQVYCRGKSEFNEVVLLNEFNAKAQRYAGVDEEGDDDQWFVRFNTPEDFTYFVMRFA